MQNQFNYAVVGGGCFGVSTALASQIEQPNTKIILFEGSEYVPLAEEPEQKSQTERPYCKFYRRTGWIQTVRGGSYKPFHSKERSIKAEDLSDMVCEDRHMRDEDGHPQRGKGTLPSFFFQSWDGPHLRHCEERGLVVKSVRSKRRGFSFF